MASEAVVAAVKDKSHFHSEVDSLNNNILIQDERRVVVNGDAAARHREVVQHLYRTRVERGVHNKIISTRHYNPRRRL